jgi:hypothetical protein
MTHGGALPNLLVIGAMKAGTSSLHRYLDQHPEIGMSAWKELNFFVDPADTSDGTWDRGVDWYRGWFDEAAPVRGESSHHYTASPFFGGVPERAVTVVPEAKLIYLVRDPVERFVSHHIERRADGLERHSLDETIAWTLEHPDNGLVARSRYFSQAERWLGHYPQERLLIVSLEEMRASLHATLARVYEFLGVDPTFRPSDISNENPRDAQREARPLMARLDAVRQRYTRDVNLRRGRRLLPPRARDAARNAWLRVGTRPVAPAEISPAHAAGLADLLREDADQLRELTGQAFAEWSV